MTKEEYQLFESYMQLCMQDSAHDREHVYRVLYVALDIAACERDVDYDILICACLLHDIGRTEQLENHELCHASVGAEKAKRFLLDNGFSSPYADEVAACIQSHRFRSDSPPTSLEAKILFDADKIDATGTLGIARTLFYKALVAEPLYSVQENGNVSDGTNDDAPSFLQEYKYKLEGLYTNFFTERGAEIARGRQTSAQSFYRSMLCEAQSSYQPGRALLYDQLLRQML